MRAGPPAHFLALVLSLDHACGVGLIFVSAAACRVDQLGVA